MRTALLAAVLLLAAGFVRVDTQAPSAVATRAAATHNEAQALADKYCATCHNPRMRAGGFAFEGTGVAGAATAPEVWEKVVRKVRTGMMPPAGASRPDRPALDRFAATIEETIDRAAAASPNPGTTALHR